MSSTYFTLPSFARAKKNKEDLEKTNPKDPVLNEEDTKFLERHMSTDEAQASTKDTGLPTKISDDGEVKEAQPEEIVHGGDDAIVPETQPPAVGGDGAQESKEQEEKDAPEQDKQGDDAATAQEEKDADATTDQSASYDDTMKEKAAERVQARKAKKSKGMDLPTQEEAEAATKGFNEKAAQEAETQQGQKKTWASYLPSMRPSSRQTDKSSEQTPEGEKKTTDEAKTTEEGDAARPDSSSQRTWTEYASSYVPSIPSLPASWTKSKDADSAPEPVYNEDGTINEEATKERQEKEVSVLLDNLNMSSINNRVFAFSGETQKIYERFALVLKDCINGAPTAYEDMDKLMREAGPKLEEQFKSMPPFVQTLVKSLPMRLGSTLGPELMAAASEKPGNDMNARLQAASKPGASGATSAAGISVPDKSQAKEGEGEAGKKKKRTIPGMKGLINEKSTVATMLRSVVNFLQTRFPFLASTTNVVMSLAVFILMFVFWYCHKRGREVRLAKEQAAGGEVTEGGEDGEEGVLEVSDSGEEGDEEEEKEGVGEEELEGVAKEADEKMQEITKTIDEKTEALSKPDPTEVPLPEQGKVEEEKA